VTKWIGEKSPELLQNLSKKTLGQLSGQITTRKKERESKKGGRGTNGAISSQLGGKGGLVLTNLFCGGARAKKKRCLSSRNRLAGAPKKRRGVSLLGENVNKPTHPTKKKQKGGGGGKGAGAIRNGGPMGAPREKRTSLGYH